MYLGLEAQDLGDRDVEVIARSPHLQKLGWLHLSLTQITRSGLEALAKSDRLPSLRKVELSGNPVHDEVEEIVENAQGQIIGVGEELFDIEKGYGRKTWLHPVLDNGGQYFDEAAL